MSDVNDLVNDFSTLKTDLTAKLADIQAALNNIPKPGLTPEQQAGIDTVDGGLKDLDTAVKGFSVPPATPAPTTPAPTA